LKPLTAVKSELPRGKVEGQRRSFSLVIPVSNREDASSNPLVCLFFLVDHNKVNDDRISPRTQLELLCCLSVK